MENSTAAMIAATGAVAHIIWCKKRLNLIRKTGYTGYRSVRNNSKLCISIIRMHDLLGGCQRDIGICRNIL